MELREDPGASRITLTARGSQTDAPISCQTLAGPPRLSSELVTG